MRRVCRRELRETALYCATASEDRGGRVRPELVRLEEIWVIDTNQAKCRVDREKEQASSLCKAVGRLHASVIVPNEATNLSPRQT